MTVITDRWLAPGPQPNGLQAAEDGLWLIDQRDNHLYKLAYEDGSVLARLPTETDRSSGVTEGGGSVWVASTYNARIYKLNGDGSTIDHYDTPGKGIVGFGDPGRTHVTGAHGLEWLDDGTMWAAVPPAQAALPDRYRHDAGEALDPHSRRAAPRHIRDQRAPVVRRHSDVQDTPARSGQRGRNGRDRRAFPGSPRNDSAPGRDLVLLCGDPPGLHHHAARVEARQSSLRH